MNDPRAAGFVAQALQAIVFDFDGVIANSEPLHLKAFQQALAEDGIELSATDYFTRYLGYDDVGMFEALARDRTELLDALDHHRLDQRVLVREAPVGGPRPDARMAGYLVERHVQPARGEQLFGGGKQALAVAFSVGSQGDGHGSHGRGLEIWSPLVVP